MEMEQGTKNWKTPLYFVFLGAVLFLTCISSVVIVYISFKVSDISEMIDSLSQEQMSLVQTAQEMNENLEGLQSNVQVIFSDLDALSDDVEMCQADLGLLQNTLEMNQDLLENLPISTVGESQPENSGLLLEEIKYRLGIYLQILEENAESMPNERAVRLLDGLRGWHIDGQQEYEGESTISLIEQQIARNVSFEFLRGTMDEISQLRSILEARRGERTAGVHQDLDYGALAEITLRLKNALQQMQMGSN